MRIFEHNFVDDKANFRRRAVARQENSTKSAAKFAEKTCANPIGTRSKYQTAFKKDYKRIKKRGYDTKLLEKVIAILADGKPLPDIYKDHNLIGDFKGCRECHILPDWLLVYEVNDEELILYLTRTGTHSDIF